MQQINNVTSIVTQYCVETLIHGHLKCETAQLSSTYQRSETHTVIKVLQVEISLGVKKVFVALRLCCVNLQILVVISDCLMWCGLFCVLIQHYAVFLP